ncbi:MAG: prepilin-type N-terminal cleavage/methylation domain-containing protein [Phycisphaerae bacterium]
MRKRNRTEVGSQKGFTLIELLVVIAIIALLVSILLPSLKQAKESAKSMYCKTNMRTVATAVRQYAHEENDLLVWYRVRPSGGFYPNGEFFTNMLVRKGVIEGQNINKVPASEDFSPFRCPNGTDEPGGQFAGAWGGGIDNPNTDPAWKGWWYDPGWWEAGYPEVNETAVRTWYSLNATNKGYSPFRVIYGLTEEQYESPDFQKDERRITNIQRGSELVLLFEGCLAFQGTRANHIAANHPPYTSPFSGGSNMAFFDGHVEGFDTTVFSDPEKNLQGSDWVDALSRHNKPIMRWEKNRGTRR